MIAGGEIETDRRTPARDEGPSYSPAAQLHRPRHRDSCRTRERNAKAAKGTITVSITPKDGDKVEITLSDDGSGIDVAKIRTAVATTGGGPKEQMASLRDEDVLAVHFPVWDFHQPDDHERFQAAGWVLPSRGEKVEKLGGMLTVETRHSEGTTFRIVLPLTLATFRGVLVRSGELLFIIPTTYVERVTRVERGEIKTIENRETIRYGGAALSPGAIS